MVEGFPLSLPDGASAVDLAWDGQEQTRGDTCINRAINSGNDQGWIIEASTDGMATATWVFGKTTFGRHLCLHRFKLWWLKPSHGNAGLDLPPETSLLLAERYPRPPSPPSSNLQPQPSQYVALLPVSDTYARSALHRAGCSTSGDHDHSDLAISADTGDFSVPLPGTLGVLLVAVGEDPFRLVRRLVGEATARLRKQLGSGGAEGGAKKGTEATVAGFVDTFGWCTWDSFYTMVTAEDVLEGLSTLHEGGVRPRWVVIDDGWQHTTNDDALNTEQWDERLVGLKANKRFRRFDKEGKVMLDLGDTVGKMKGDFGVKEVLAWHAMAGYWAGVEPTAAEMDQFDPSLANLVAPAGIRDADPEMQPELNEKRFGMVPAQRVEAFYLAYHKYLRDNGVDGVKVDAQSILDCMGGGNGGVPAVTKAYHEGLNRSVQAMFTEGDRPAALIHCMCHAPSVLFHIACVSQNRAVIRGSDDFYPREDSSHGPHLYANAYNSLLLSSLGVQDWDMFQTGLGNKKDDGSSGAPVERSNASWFHAAARAISGGPVYVSDRPGQHNRDILAKLVLEDGSVLRAQTNALPKLDCLMRDPQVEGGGLLQIWSLNELTGTAVVGSFNVRGTHFSQSERTWVRLEDGEIPAVKGTVSPSDVHAFNAGNRQKNRDTCDKVSFGHQEETAKNDQPIDEEEVVCVFEEAYAVYLHRQKEVGVVGLRETVDVEVLPLSYELATFSRVLDVCLKPRTSGRAGYGGGVGVGGEEVIRWAPLGLADMFNSSAAITKQEVIAADAAGGGAVPGVCLWVKGSGEFLAVASRRPTRATLESGDVGGQSDSTSEGSTDHGLSGAKGGDANVDAVLDVSFSRIAGPSALRGGGGMGVVEVHIPAPWDGRGRRLVFCWGYE